MNKINHLHQNNSKYSSCRTALIRMTWFLLCLGLFLNWMIAPSVLVGISRNIAASTLSCSESLVDANESAEEWQHRPPSSPSRDVCSGYDGVLRIRSGDVGAAAGTVFFIYMVNHLIYAEMHNLLPWVHLDNTSERIYDEQVHGKGPTVSFRMIPGNIENGAEFLPREPQVPSRRAEPELFEVNGTGVWEHYFEPVSEFSPRRNYTCWTKKPLYEIDYDGVAGGMHLEADWAVRAWVYGSISIANRKKRIRDWLRPMRRRGASIVRRYIRPKRWLRQAADQANPLKEGQKCLAMHVRWTDKDLSGGRSEAPVSDFLPHVKKFLEKNPNGIIFLATDSSLTFPKIKEQWPRKIVRRVRIQESVIRSKSSDPTFDLAPHHRTNKEVLVDIYAMAKCSMLVHGRSAVSEAVLYINPDIREASVDIDGDDEIINDLGWWDSE